MIKQCALWGGEARAAYCFRMAYRLKARGRRAPTMHMHLRTWRTR